MTRATVVFVSQHLEVEDARRSATDKQMVDGYPRERRASVSAKSRRAVQPQPHVIGQSLTRRE